MRIKPFQRLALAVAATAVFAAAGASAQTAALPKTTLNVVGSVGNLTTYREQELPFWSQTVPQASGGAIAVNVKPFTELGLRGPEVFRLVSQGSLQIASPAIGWSAGEVPINDATDLVGLNGSIEELRKVLEAFRAPWAEDMAKNHNVKLLGFGVNQAQVIYCRDAFASLTDLRGRKVRASGVSQQVFFEHLGASPIFLSFAETQPALANGVVDCAVTGTLAGYKAHWHEASSYLSAIPLTYGLITYIANLDWWNKQDPAVQAFLETQVRALEEGVFAQGALETDIGIACNTGASACPQGSPGRMTLVAETEADIAVRRQALEQAVLPNFKSRCGEACARLWNETIGKVSGALIR